MIGDTNHWNSLDKGIFFLETAVAKIVRAIKHEGTPNPEEMILAATKHLQEENEHLKAIRIPGRLTFNEKNSTYICPMCGIELSQELIENYQIKHCIECGKRLFRPEKNRVNNPE